MKLRTLFSLVVLSGLLLGLTGSAWGVNIYMMSSGNTDADAALQQGLSAYGHNVTVGPEYLQFNGTEDLSGIQVVYLSANYNYAMGDMPPEGRTPCWVLSIREEVW